MEDGVKTEFINGEVYVSPPDRLRHIKARINIGVLLGAHVAIH
jgi:hypothetical protein